MPSPREAKKKSAPKTSVKTRATANKPSPKRPPARPAASNVAPNVPGAPPDRDRPPLPPLPTIPVDQAPWRAQRSAPSDNKTVGDRTRERIRDVAFEVFAERGFEGTSTREICARAGVNGAALNYHWRSKQALWEAVCERVGAWFGDVAKGIDLSAHPRVTIAQFLRSVFDGLARDPRPIRVIGWASLLPSGADQEGVTQHFRPFVGFAYTYVRMQQSMGAIPASIDVESVALLVHSMLTYTIMNTRGMQSVFGKDLRDPELAVRMREAIVSSALTLLGIAEQR